MTQNQIAYAGFTETVRHDREMEEISKRQNIIAEERNRINQTYQDRLNTIQEEYNNAYLEMQNAQGQEKLDIQHQLADIEEYKAYVDREYKTALNEIGYENVATNKKAVDETIRYNKVLNDLGYTNAEIQAQLANIREKQVEYEKYYNDQMVRIQDFNALVNKTRTDNTYEIESIRNEMQQMQIEMQKQFQEYQQAQIVTHSFGKE